MSDGTRLPPEHAAALRRGLALPAHPLALTRGRRLDVRRQRALTRYYAEAGAGGLAIGVHTTQFALRAPEFDLLRPVLELAVETLSEHEDRTGERLLRVAGICGPTPQATAEAALARDLGYDLGLLSLAALTDADEDSLLDHCRAVGTVLPLFGFYLQPAVGGRILPYSFWRRLADLPSVAAIKVAPFNRYQTLDVVRAIDASGRQDEIALYTGNDDHIVLDLLGPFAGGLLGHWAVWTRPAVELLDEIRALRKEGGPIPASLLERADQVTDMNGALFDAAHNYRGCIPGVHEVLRRQGLLEGTWCLDPDEGLSPGQSEELDRVIASYPHLVDDAFVAQHRDRWLS